MIQRPELLVLNVLPNLFFSGFPRENMIGCLYLTMQVVLMMGWLNIFPTEIEAISCSPAGIEG